MEIIIIVDNTKSLIVDETAEGGAAQDSSDHSRAVHGEAAQGGTAKDSRDHYADSNSIWFLKIKLVYFAFNIP